MRFPVDRLEHGHRPVVVLEQVFLQLGEPSVFANFSGDVARHEFVVHRQVGRAKCDWGEVRLLQTATDPSENGTCGMICNCVQVFHEREGSVKGRRVLVSAHPSVGHRLEPWEKGADGKFQIYVGAKAGGGTQGGTLRLSLIHI